MKAVTIFSAWGSMHLRNDAPSLFLLTTFARRMRMAPTKSEALLWQQLRGRKLGARFRRQAVLGGCIVDFYAPCERLVVEVDGAVHRTPEARVHDARRQAWLELAFGVRFVRVDAELVERDVLAAVARVREALG
ncbi:MAG TPA: endonuclease domain-containing protein [Polyangiaceae bacterium]|nr:endonuclease domain-containing protein [Polyangiaceae bacterium]